MTAQTQPLQIICLGAESRDAATWNRVTERRLSVLPYEVVQSVSDEATALKNTRKKGCWLMTPQTFSIRNTS